MERRVLELQREAYSVSSGGQKVKALALYHLRRDPVLLAWDTPSATPSFTFMTQG